MSLFDFLHLYFEESLEEKTNCFLKATIIKYEDEMLFVANEKNIFYFGTIPAKRKTKMFYKFFKKQEKDMKGKFFLTRNIQYMKNHCQSISSNAINEHYCKWL